MSIDALPCIVCGKHLVNVFEDAENQPADGLVITTHGNYGSTVFDPMDGNFLEFNVCDECIVRAGEQGRVYTARTSKPVVLEGAMVVGATDADYRPVPWKRGTPLLTDVYPIGVEDLDALPDGVRLTPGLTPEDLRSLVLDDLTEETP